MEKLTVSNDQKLSAYGVGYEECMMYIEPPSNRYCKVFCTKSKNPQPFDEYETVPEKDRTRKKWLSTANENHRNLNSDEILKTTCSILISNERLSL